MNAKENSRKDKNSDNGKKIYFRISDDEYRKFEQLFIQSGMNSRSKFIKKCLFGNKKSEPKQKKRLKKNWEEVELLLRKIKTETLYFDDDNI